MNQVSTRTYEPDSVLTVLEIQEHGEITCVKANVKSFGAITGEFTRQYSLEEFLLLTNAKTALEVFRENKHGDDGRLFECLRRVSYYFTAPFTACFTATMPMESTDHPGRPESVQNRYCRLPKETQQEITVSNAFLRKDITSIKMITKLWAFSGGSYAEGVLVVTRSGDARLLRFVNFEALIQHEHIAKQARAILGDYFYNEASNARKYTEPVQVFVSDRSLNEIVRSADDRRLLEAGEELEYFVDMGLL